MIAAPKSRWLERSFRAYNRRYLRRSFHRVHLDGDLAHLRGDGANPLIVCLNHSSWWDLLLGIFLSEHLAEWDSYAAMDERQLARYRFFARLGCIGVDRTSLAGAREFVAHCATLLEGKPRALWMTPQGQFTSPAIRPVQFQPGVGAIAKSLSSFYVSTVVLDYEFWTEKLPEAFISVRPPEYVQVGAGFDRREFVRLMEHKMEAHLDQFTALRLQRNPALFTTMLSSAGGVSPVYDAIRAVAATLRGEQIRLSHHEAATPAWSQPESRESPR